MYRYCVKSNDREHLDGGNIQLQRVADEVAVDGNHACAVLRCTEWESGVGIRVRAGHGTHKSLASLLER